MAYDGYRNPSAPPSSMSPMSPQNYAYDYPDPRSSYASLHPNQYMQQQQEPRVPPSSRSRASSSVRADARPSPESFRYPPPPPAAAPPPPSSFPPAAGPPDGMSASFNRDLSDYPPDLVNQITQQVTQDVLKRLSSTTIRDNGSGPAPYGQAPPPTGVPPQGPPPPPPKIPTPSNSSSPSVPPRNAYTPPSPPPRAEFPPFGSPATSQTASMSASQTSPKEVPSSRFTERRTSPLQQNVDSGYARPPKPASAPVHVDEETTLEKYWGRLFDEVGYPTRRLGEFLRGLAVHLIEDYEPKKSLVITPTKMAKFYDAVQLKHEVYNWHAVFQKMSNATISRLYRDLGCQHHLVQERFDEAPFIPGLTPYGFEQWMTLLIQVQPDEEHERLAKAVLNMPISNADKPAERFPKEISRRLFPAEPNLQAREQFERALEGGDSRSSRGSSYDPQPPPLPREPGSGPKVKPGFAPGSASAPVPPPPSTMPPGFEERERKPYGKKPAATAATTSTGGAPSAGRVSDAAVVDDDELDVPDQPPQPIERERKPYSAAPGGGKFYEDTAARPHRANSTSTKTRPVPISTTASGRTAEVPMPMPIPDPPPPRTSTSAHPPPHLGGTGGGQRRPRTPSFGTHDYRHSEGDLLGYQATVPFDLDEDNRRYAREAERRNNEWARKQAEEEARMFESPRERERYDRLSDFGLPRRGYEDEYYRGTSSGRGNGYDYSAGYPPYR